jgi:CRP-like cAMP-binding protein
MVLRSNVQGSSSVFGWGVLISYTAISTGFNIAHSPGALLDQASHAIPPISLCISVEVLMNIIRSDLTAEVTTGVTASPQLSDKEDRGTQIRSYIEMHPDVTAADIARSFGVTRQTASRHLNKVKVMIDNGDRTGT